MTNIPQKSTREYQVRGHVSRSTVLVLCVGLMMTGVVISTAAYAEHGQPSGDPHDQVIADQIAKGASFVTSRGEEISAWVGPRRGGGSCAFFQSPSPSHGDAFDQSGTAAGGRGGVCLDEPKSIRPTAPVQRYVSFGWEARGDGMFSVLVTGSTPVRSPVEFTLVGAAGSLPSISSSRNTFVAELPEATEFGVLPQGGPYYVVATDVRGTELFRADLQKVLDDTKR